MRKIIHIIIYIFICIIFIPFSAFSQSHYFHNYSVDEGLPFVQVNTIIQDEHGYLWCGGYGGLSKFNGKSFKNYTTLDGLAHHSVSSLAIDGKQRLFIGTFNGLSIYENNTFKTYTTQQGLAGNNVRFVYYDNSGFVWVCTDKGVNTFDGKSFFVPSGLKQYQGQNFNCAFKDAEGSVWLGTDKGIVYFNNGEAVQYNIGKTNYIAQSPEGKILAGTTAGLKIGNASGKFEPLLTHGLLDVSTVNSIIVDKRKNIWIASTNGLYKYSEGKFKYYNIKSEFHTDIAYSLFIDYESNLWIGSNSGLYKYRGDVFVNYNEDEGLLNSFVIGLLKDKHGNTWIGTDGGGVFVYTNGGFENFNKSNSGIISDNIIAFLQDLDGGILVATRDGLSKYKKHKFETFSGKNGLAEGPVLSLYFDNHNTLYLSQGSKVYFRKGDTFELIKEIKLPETAEIYALEKDNTGALWIGTWLGGLWKYDGKRCVHVVAKNLPGDDCPINMVKDKTGRIYFTSFYGLMYTEDNGKTFKNINTKNGLSSNLTYSLMFDDNERTLWIGTNQGINKLDLDALHNKGTINIIRFNKEEGFVGVECNANSTLKNDDGSVFFGTVNGLVKYNPGEFIANRAESKLNLTGFKIFYKDTLLPPRAQLPHNENNISFEFIGICLTSPTKVKYQYKLDGYDKAWSPETDQNVARYINLQPGKYTFNVISCNNEGVWNKEPVSYTFTILTPFWKTTWFRILASLIIASVITMAIWWRVKQIKEKEQDKTSLASNELRSLRSQMNPHFIFNALNSIQYFVLNNDTKSTTKYLNKFAKLIRKILNNTEKSVVSLSEEIEQLNLYLEMEQLRLDNKLTYSMTVDPEVEAEEPEVPTMLIQPYIENAILHGIVPKKENGHVSIRFERKDHSLVCIVEDNGIGRTRSMELKAQSIRTRHQSVGMKITRDRLELLNRVHKSNLSVNVIDLFDIKGDPSGTRVEIFIPVENN